ncbi:nuclear transport factor 2 family protein [soil metagenome]
MEAQRAKTFIDALHRLEEQSDVEPIASLYTGGADISNPVVQHAHTGQEGARDFWTAYRDTFDTIHSDFHHVLEEADTAVLEWTSRGRSAAGEEFFYRGVSVLEFEGDRIAAFRAYFDPRQLGEQLTGDE